MYPSPNSRFSQSITRSAALRWNSSLRARNALYCGTPRRPSKSGSLEVDEVGVSGQARVLEVLDRALVVPEQRLHARHVVQVDRVTRVHPDRLGQDDLRASQAL